MLWNDAFECDKQESLESDAIAITESDDELVEGNNKVNSVDDGFVEVIDGEIEDGAAEDREMDPISCISAGKQEWPIREKLSRLMSIFKKNYSAHVRKSWTGRC